MLVVVELGIGHAYAFDLAALDRERRIADALVALDDTEPGAEHVVEHGRNDAERGSGTAARCDHLARKQIVDGLDRRSVPVDANPARERIAAEPVEAARIDLDVGLAHAGLAGEIA